MKILSKSMQGASKSTGKSLDLQGFLICQIIRISTTFTRTHPLEPHKQFCILNIFEVCD